MEPVARRIPTPQWHDGEEAVSALRSALRRRGAAATDGDLPGSVRAEHAGRRITVRLMHRQWWRTVPGRPDVTVPVARQGAEDLLARQLVCELLGRL
ncbi:hypothetical protein [Nocardiopsis sp. CC223A]|uniref:hypothetical protein n=1 Tax=Nocardiopsis sp. CC223A TaxID=3044051 RepID=UPI00278BBC7E|nr:hypothetical protein [Nocardiopsis sp. CC223A]